MSYPRGVFMAGIEWMVQVIKVHESLLSYLLQVTYELLHHALHVLQSTH